jgi:L,D-transpeptidase ErfK/SrfK
MLPLLGEEIVGQECAYVVQSGDSFSSIGARYGESPAVIAYSNGLSLSRPIKAGMTLTIDNRHIAPKSDLTDGILINIPQRILFHFRTALATQAFPVGLGRPDWPTPTGRFRAVQMQRDKEWLVPKSIQEEMRREGKQVLTCVLPGPDNPLGGYWIGLSICGIGIHGTIAPSSVYHFRSHGCIRLHPDDVAALIADVTVGESGNIVYLPVLLARVRDRVFLEVHADVYKRGINALALVRSVSERDGLNDLVDWDRVDAVVLEKAGVAREIGQI